jgi:Ca2+-binding EF-hand superfamily protein
MGARTIRPGFNQWDTNQIERATGLSAQEIQQIQQKFFQASGRDGVLNMNEFANIYSSFPGARNQPNLQQQISHVFPTFDRDHAGGLSFDEFFNAVVMMNHDMPCRDRIEHLICQNNAYRQQQGDGRISSS